MIGNKPIYWTGSGNYVLYYCYMFKWWVIESGVGFTNPKKIPPNACYSYVRSSYSAELPSQAIYWEEFLENKWTKTENVAVTSECSGMFTNVAKYFLFRNKVKQTHIIRKLYCIAHTRFLYYFVLLFLDASTSAPPPTTTTTAHPPATTPTPGNDNVYMLANI